MEILVLKFEGPISNNKENRNFAKKSQKQTERLTRDGKTGKKTFYTDRQTERHI